MIAKCCIHYLRLEEFESWDFSSLDSETMKSQHRFLAYAAYYWTQHYDDYDQNILFDVALDLCKPTSIYHNAWTMILRSCAAEQGINKSASMYGWSALMVATRFGFNSMIGKLLEEGENPGAKSLYKGQMALHIAAEYGHSLVAKTLLDAKSTPDLSTEDISHALSK